MIEDELESLTDQLRGRRCLADDGHGRLWHGRLAGTTGDGPNIAVLFEHPDRGGSMIAPLMINRETLISSAFEPASGPTGWRTPARLVVRTGDGTTVTVTEDDPAARPERAPAPSTKQGRRPSQFTAQGEFAR